MKNSYIRLLLPLIFLFAFSFYAFGQQEDALVKILENELDREMSYFKKTGHPPYYIDYQVNDIYTVSISSDMGSLISSDDFHIRYFSNNVRVGDYDFDNTHTQKAGYFNISMPSHSFAFIPTSNNPLAISQIIWDKTEGAYKQALRTYLSKKENPNKEKQDFPDFSKEEPNVYIEPMDEKRFSFDLTSWEKRLKSYTAPFLEDTSVFHANAQLTYYAQRKYFLSTEKSKIVQNSSYINLNISARIKSIDDNIVPYSISYFAEDSSGLPPHDSIMKEIKTFRKKLYALAKAPVAEAYTGPAILSSQATGVFFHEIFGHRVEGHRLKDDSDGHTFKDKINTKVLPKYINLAFDPTKKMFESTQLIGSYKYDDQGVKAQKVQVIEDGILKRYLMSRTPNELFHQSNGHGRSAGTLPAVSRQSNMFIETKKPKSFEYLRKKLIKECKKQGKEYGYYFKEVTGGFTNTSRYRPDVFNIQPLEVYRIYVDGRPDELVRGVSLIGTPLLMFSEIEATGSNYGVFNGICGAESGGIPVSAIAPPILVRKIETQKEPVSDVSLPILEDPYYQEILEKAQKTKKSKN